VSNVVRIAPNDSLAADNAAIADHLERLAARIRKGEWGDLMRAQTVLVPHTGQISCFNAGSRTDYAQGIGTFHMAATFLATGQLDSEDD